MEGQEVSKVKWYNWTGDPMWNDYCKVGSIIIATCLVLLGLLFGIAASAQPAGNCLGKDGQDVCANTQPVLDHSNCQYPDRWTNPANGCDNSDPAVPECIKAFSTEQGEKDCIAAFVAEHEPVQVSEPLPIMEGK